MSTRSVSDTNGMRLWLKPILSGVITGIFSVTVLIILSALISSVGILPLKAASIIASVSCAVGSFFGGYIAAKRLKKNGLLCGAVSGAVLYLIFTFVSLVAFTSAPTVSTLIRLVIFVAAGAIGGIIGVGNSSKTKIV